MSAASTASWTSNEGANTALLNGDPEAWLAIVAEQDQQSIFGGFGGLGEPGAAEVHDHYLLAAGAFQPAGAQIDVEYLVKDVRSRLAYTVALERARSCTQARPGCSHISCSSP